MLPINYEAVFIATVVSFIIGFLWHGPVLGGMYMRLSGLTMPTGDEKKKMMTGMWKPMLANLVVNFMMALITAGVYLAESTSTVMGGVGVIPGIIVSAWLWFGFAIPLTSMTVIWGIGGKYISKKLWVFEAAYWLVMMCSMGAIIGGMM